ncbi:MAG: 50S ribosomal protein L18e [Candidatus Heimdallarchaeota archaeon]
MVKPTRSTDPNIIALQRYLRQAASQHKAPIWKTAEKALFKPRRNQAEVNVAHINRISSDNETVLILGKVLGTGALAHPVTVAALKFSISARSKIEQAGGECLSLPELIEKNPRGSGVRILR